MEIVEVTLFIPLTLRGKFKECQYFKEEVDERHQFWHLDLFRAGFSLSMEASVISPKSSIDKLVKYVKLYSGS